MCRASLISKVVLFFAWQSAGLLPQYWVLLSPGMLCYGQFLCFSPSGGGSVLLYAGLEGSLCMSPLYIRGRNYKGSGTQLPTSSPAGLGLWLLSAVCEGWMPIGRLFGCCILCIPISHFHLGLLHRGWMLLLEAPLLALSVWGLLAIFTKVLGYPFFFPGLLWGGPLQFVYSSLSNGSWSVEEAGDNTFHVAWVVRGEVQILVCVGGLSVDTYVKGSIILVVKECVQER